MFYGFSSMALLGSVQTHSRTWTETFITQVCGLEMCILTYMLTTLYTPFILGGTSCLIRSSLFSRVRPMVMVTFTSSRTSANDRERFS